ncbi:MAG: hypothetical protein COC16_02855 [Lutibacter sp.]|nr:MAG: hypothetical protein COC16_02855 [Lutibacter sp.]
MKNILKISIFFLLLIALISCEENKQQRNNHKNSIRKSEELHTKDNNNEEESSTMVTLKLNQLNVMNIELGIVSQVNLGSTLKVNGQLELPPQKKASVSTILGGRLQSISVIEGDYVKKGQVVAYLNNPEIIKMQRDYLSVKSSFTFLENEYQRKKILLNDGITSVKSFQQTEADYYEVKSSLSASKSTLQLMGLNIATIEKGIIVSSIPIIAPIKGYVQNIEINIGKYVSPTKEMFEIVDNEFLHLGLKVFEKDIDKAKVGQIITFSLTTRSDKIYEAEIFALGKAFDMDTRAVKVHAKIVGTHEGLLTGMFVDARIIITNTKVNALPDAAFVNEDGLDYIFIQIEKNKEEIVLEKIQVNRGVSDLGFSEVVFVNDMQNNMIVVTKGAYYVNAELNKGEFGEHNH